MNIILVRKAEKTSSSDLVQKDILGTSVSIDSESDASTTSHSSSSGQQLRIERLCQCFLLTIC